MLVTVIDAVDVASFQECTTNSSFPSLTGIPMPGSTSSARSDVGAELVVVAAPLGFDVRDVLEVSSPEFAAIMNKTRTVNTAQGHFGFFFLPTTGAASGAGGSWFRG
nr:hypothetical protein [Rhodococcus rhodochrous]